MKIQCNRRWRPELHLRALYQIWFEILFVLFQILWAFNWACLVLDGWCTFGTGLLVPLYQATLIECIWTIWKRTNTIWTQGRYSHLQLGFGPWCCIQGNPSVAMCRMLFVVSPPPLQESGPLDSEAMVMGILDQAFDVLVLRYGVQKRIYCKVSATQTTAVLVLCDGTRLSDLRFVVLFTAWVRVVPNTTAADLGHTVSTFQMFLFFIGKVQKEPLYFGPFLTVVFNFVPCEHDPGYHSDTTSSFMVQTIVFIVYYDIHDKVRQWSRERRIVT